MYDHRLVQRNSHIARARLPLRGIQLCTLPTEAVAKLVLYLAWSRAASARRGDSTGRYQTEKLAATLARLAQHSSVRRSAQYIFQLASRSDQTAEHSQLFCAGAGADKHSLDNSDKHNADRQSSQSKTLNGLSRSMSQFCLLNLRKKKSSSSFGQLLLCTPPTS